jgi:hypothetical protein
MVDKKKKQWRGQLPKILNKFMNNENKLQKIYAFPKYYKSFRT